MRDRDSDNDNNNNDNVMEVVTRPRPDLVNQRVSCVFCNSPMGLLPGMPPGHNQWMCSNCGTIAYEGYGDTPARNTKYETLSISNDPYPMDDPAGTRPYIKDIEMDTDGIDEEDKAHLARVEHTIGGRRIRRPARYYFGHQSAAEATREI